MNSLFRRVRHGQDGQVLAMVVFLLAGLLGVAALSIDIGFIIHAQRELQASTDAAAMAGAQELSNNNPASSAVAFANSYSGISGGQNAFKDLPSVAMVSGYPLAKCLTSTGICSSCPCSNTSGDNAIAVEEQVKVSTHFAQLFGIKSITLTAQSLVSMKGGTPIPANIMVIVDTTSSMGNGDSSCKSATGISSPTRLDCAKWGVRTLLSSFSPCSASLSSCGSVTNGNVANPIQTVGLLVFPGLTSSSYASDDYTNCQATSISPYISKYATATSQPPYFTIIQPSSDYRTSDTSALNGGNSNLVKSVDWADGVGCTSSAYGLQNPGGQNTFYAGVITEAQTDLSALSSPRSTMQNAIIILSDGDAGAGSSNFTSASLSSQPTLDQNECHAAISAAQTAAATANSAGLKTWVYSVAYGSSTSSSSSCSTDSPPISGCTTMTSMASDATKFYSDGASGCVSTAHPTMTSLGSIFGNITNDFLTTRVLPWSTP
jgi:Flp pilus assembly protein TadG